jgi:mannose-6-phosphate isomerase-like protein (cupin superfamily)
MKPRAVSIADELAKLPRLEGRTPQTTVEEEEPAFATLSDFDNGGIFTGSFSGQSPWERHLNGDELVQVIAGQTQLTILSEDDETVLNLSAGMLTVVPQGQWHRFSAPDGVSVLTMTPQPTDHSTMDDPRRDKE